MRRPLWQKAASFAARKHEHQHRDDDETPYFSHPARVAMTVVHTFGCTDETAIAAAFLHDVIENSDTSLDEIEEECGEEVADLVSALTKNNALAEKEAYRDYHQRLLAANWRARLVKLADQFDNYSDTFLGLKEGKSDVRRKCEQALELVKDDLKKHKEIAHAADLLRALIKKQKSD